MNAGIRSSTRGDLITTRSVAEGRPERVVIKSRLGSAFICVNPQFPPLALCVYLMGVYVMRF